MAAGESYFIAALLYGSAKWPIFAHTPENDRLGEKKIECYTRYVQYANHEIRRVGIPFQGSAIPAWLHLPNIPFSQISSNGNRGQLPCVMSIPGMDSFKETGGPSTATACWSGALPCWLLTAPARKRPCPGASTSPPPTGWTPAGPSWTGCGRSRSWTRTVSPSGATAWVPFWGTQVASIDDRIKGCAVQAVCHEPGMNTIFNVASPTFKLRFMYMAGYEDEDEFDRFAETMTLEGVGEKVTCPYLVLAGEDDHLSPIEYTYQLMDTVRAPKQLVLYEGADHGLGGSSSADLGPNPATLAADWLKDRLDGKPMESQHILIDMAGQTQVSSFADYARTV